MNGDIVLRKLKSGKYNIIVGATVEGGEAIDSVSEYILGKKVLSIINPHSETLPKTKAPKLKTTKKTSMRGKK